MLIAFQLDCTNFLLLIYFLICFKFCTGKYYECIRQMLLFSVRLPWEITAVMLADTIDGYRKMEERLISEFHRCFVMPLSDQILNTVDGGIVHWIERRHPRKYEFFFFVHLNNYLKILLV